MASITPLASRISLRERCPLEPRKIFKYGSRWLVKGLVVWSVIVCCLLWKWSAGKPELSLAGHLYEHIPLLGGVAILFALIAFTYPSLYFFSYFYDVDDRNVIIRKGVLAKREIILPFSRITDINVEQDWFDVVLGLYDIHISTPTAESGKFAHIDGVNRQSATIIRQILIDRINSINFEHVQNYQLKLANVA